MTDVVRVRERDEAGGRGGARADKRAQTLILAVGQSPIPLGRPNAVIKRQYSLGDKGVRAGAGLKHLPCKNPGRVIWYSLHL